MNEELKPCPFCGYALMVDLYSERRHYIHCPSCETDGPKEKTPEQAVTAWNRHATPALIGLPVLDPSLLEVGK